MSDVQGAPEGEVGQRVSIYGGYAEQPGGDRVSLASVVRIVIVFPAFHHTTNWRFAYRHEKEYEDHDVVFISR